MTSYPQMHVKRIYHINEDGSEDTSIWIDVLRVDKFFSTYRVAPDEPAYQGAVWTLKWLDGDEENNNPDRLTHELVVYNPIGGAEDPPPNPGDPGTVSLWLVDRLTTLAQGLWNGRMGQGARRLFKNYPPSTDDDPTQVTTLRQVNAIRVVNNDLNGLDMSAPVDWATYLTALKAGTQNPGNYVDVEVVRTFKTFANPMSPAQQEIASPGRERITFFGGIATRKAFGADTLSTLASLFSTSPPNADPVFRTDPYQVIVNVNWSPGYFFVVTFNYSDKLIVQRTPLVESSFVVSAHVTIVDNAPSGMLVYHNVVAVPGETASDGDTVFSYFETFIFNVGSLPDYEEGHPIPIGFSLTDQDTDTDDYVFGTAPSSSPAFGVTILSNAEWGDTQFVDPTTGPWPVMSAVALYPQAAYQVDPTDELNPLQPINPDVVPGPSATLNFVKTKVTTVPSTDIYYYDPPFPGSFPPDPSPVTTGGEYSLVGLFEDGSLDFNLATFPVIGSAPATRVPAIWPTTPEMRQVDYVMGLGLTQSGAFFFPNPVPPYNYGVYTVFPDPSSSAGSPEDGSYQSGGPPIPDNSYTGTYP